LALASRGAPAGGQARFLSSLSPLAARQAVLFGSFLPIRPGIGTDTPAAVQTMRGPKDGTWTSSDQASALKTAPWWHNQRLTESERTPWARMLPTVIGLAAQATEASAGIGAVYADLQAMALQQVEQRARPISGGTACDGKGHHG
jgi:hypothetical protein